MDMDGGEGLCDGSLKCCRGYDRYQFHVASYFSISWDNTILEMCFIRAG